MFSHRQLRWLPLVSVLVLGNLRLFGELAHWPSDIVLPLGESVRLPAGLPFLRASGNGAGQHGGQVVIRPMRVGESEVVLSLGPWPVERVRVVAVRPEFVIPGGQAVGILAHGPGTEIVATDPSFGSARPAPAQGLGLRPGDRLLAVNGKPVTADAEIVRWVDESGRRGRAVRLVVSRGEAIFRVRARPVLDPVRHRYRLGLWVKDEVAGIGTLSFVLPSGRFVALGHGVTDYNGGRLLPIRRGVITGATIEGVTKSRAGSPGRKIGVIDAGEDLRGEISKNSAFGISGKLIHLPVGRELPLATPSQIRLGPAILRTVVAGNMPEDFTVAVRGVRLGGAAEKGLFIEVTDRRLLRETGGIVQGMSGSPLLQDGRLIGAVTHVLVRDPRFGYGSTAWSLAAALGGSTAATKR